LLLSWLLLPRWQSSWTFALSSSLPLAGSPSAVSATPLLSDLETPTLLIDVDAARTLILSPEQGRTCLDNPSLQLTDTHALVPFPGRWQAGPSAGGLSRREEGRLVVPTQRWLQQDESDSSSAFSSNVFYLHARVAYERTMNPPTDIRGRSTFICQLDLPSTAKTSGAITARERREITIPCAQLVLGLNNHHVGSYYWARSVGAGASM
jgi:hypothetical protein